MRRGMMRILIVALFLLTVGGCSHKVTIEDLESLQVWEEAERKVAESNLGVQETDQLRAQLSTIDDVKRICGKPDRELLIEKRGENIQDEDMICWVYNIDGEEFILGFQKFAESSDENFVLQIVQNLSKEIKQFIESLYLEHSQEPLPLSWQ